GWGASGAPWRCGGDGRGHYRLGKRSLAAEGACRGDAVAARQHSQLERNRPPAPQRLCRGAGPLASTARTGRFHRCGEAEIVTEPLGVSIIVVNYNNERFLAAAIDSALNQDHPLCEVIVVDDCSTDNSRTLIAQYGDRVRSVLRDTNGHQVVALNSAWPLARYPILIFLDSDDLLLPHAAAVIARN